MAYVDDVNANIDRISLGSILFRQWDRINRISEREFSNSEEKINTISWAIKLFRNSIPNTIIDKTFEEEEKKIITKHLVILENKRKHKDYSLTDDLDNNSELLQLCINLLADKGVLYNKVSNGTYDESQT